jgi:ankyrin repeat protein
MLGRWSEAEYRAARSRLNEMARHYQPGEKDAEFRNSNGHPLLHCMVREENLPAIVLLIIVDGCDVNIRDRDYQTALFTATMFDHFGPAKLLLELGADVNAENYNNWTPLYVATRYNHTKIVDLLLEAHADKTIKPYEGYEDL